MSGGQGRPDPSHEPCTRTANRRMVTRTNDDGHQISYLSRARPLGHTPKPTHYHSVHPAPPSIPAPSAVTHRDSRWMRGVGSLVNTGTEPASCHCHWVHRDSWQARARHEAHALGRRAQRPALRDGVGRTDRSCVGCWRQAAGGRWAQAASDQCHVRTTRGLHDHSS